MLSVVIPSNNDIYLQKTIDSLLDNSRGEIEVIAVLDGYWTTLKPDKRVKIIHHGKAKGMRDAINAGVAIAKGDFIMRTDEHCMFSEGYDIIMAESCKDDWIMTSTRYFLDPVKWEVLDIPPVKYEELVIQSIGENKKFTGYPKESPYKEKIHPTQAMQGSMWFMKKSWWDKVIKKLDSERYGTLIQDSHEMVFKTWKAGGQLIMNENTWYAHKHVSFPRTHSYPSDEAEETAKKMYEDWIDYYREIKKTWKK